MALLAGVACAAGALLAGLSGCGEEKLREEIVREIDAVTEGDVVNFSLPNKNDGQPNWVWLAPPESQQALSSADMAAAIAVIDSHRSDSRLGGTRLRLVIGDEKVVMHPLVEATWSDDGSGEERVLTSIVANDPNAGLSANEFRIAYGEWMCKFPRLEELVGTGPGSDFSRAGQCTPDLKSLSIGAWDASRGYEGLGDLGTLEWLA
ncbi:MAG: hypothetical protein LBD77_01260, partial [Bifidobacteriaceae bacterium]|nr:hypothetical protein [Bifidobacteriaceae bacterium]